MAKDDSLKDICEEATDRKVEELRKFLEGLPEKERYVAAWRLIFDAAVWGTCSPNDALGLMEDIKFSLWHSAQNCEQDNIEDEDLD